MLHHPPSETENLKSLSSIQEIFQFELGKFSNLTTALMIGRPWSADEEDTESARGSVDDASTSLAAGDGIGEGLRYAMREIVDRVARSFEGRGGPLDSDDAAASFASASIVRRLAPRLNADFWLDRYLSEHV